MDGYFKVSDGYFKGFKVQNNQRNMITAVVLIALLMLGWELGLNYFYPQPDTPPPAASFSCTAQSAVGTLSSKRFEWQVVRMPAVS